MDCGRDRCTDAHRLFQARNVSAQSDIFEEKQISSTLEVGLIIIRLSIDNAPHKPEENGCSYEPKMNFTTGHDTKQNPKLAARETKGPRRRFQPNLKVMYMERITKLNSTKT